MKLDELKKEIQAALKDMEILVDEVSYEKTSGNYNTLNVVLDKVGGIDIDLIVEATNIINPIVDKFDITQDSYILDVSSKVRGGNKNE